MRERTISKLLRFGKLIVGAIVGPVSYIQPPPSEPKTLSLDTDDLEGFISKMRRIREVSEVAPGGKYRHWDTLRHLTPPEGLSPEEWWVGVKLARSVILRELPLRDAEGHPFFYAAPDEAQSLLHYIDQRTSGEIAVSEVIEDEAARRHYLMNSVMEEAIRSSQLEGARTSHVAAKAMIRSGREPTDKSERMILNNFRAMRFIREDRSSRLTPRLICELQRIVTEGTLENPDAAGRIQSPDEDRIGVWEGDVLVHQPPPAEQLPERMERMCRFANKELDVEGFLHPVVRAVLLHFWLAYDHPFEDGNGRTARALFYWYMRKENYWLTEFLSISKIFRDAPSQYGDSFLYTETDERDTTYFILYHLEVIRRAVEELHKYLTRKMQEVREFEDSIGRSNDLNYRQLEILRDAVRRSAGRYTFKSHSRSHSVSFGTARADLLDLQNRGLLFRRRSGREYVFSPAPDLAQRLRGDMPGAKPASD